MVAEIVFNRNRNFSGVKQLAKELMKMQRETWSNGQVRVECPNEQNIFRVDLIIMPNDGLYYGAELRFNFEFTDDYPASAPRITSSTKVLHPNISADDDDICLNILDGSSLSLEDYAHALLWLLNNPALDDPLFSFDYDDFDHYQSMLRESIIGGVEISNCYFDGCLREGITKDMVMNRPYLRERDIAPDLDADIPFERNAGEEEEEEEEESSMDICAPNPMIRSDSKATELITETVFCESPGSVAQLVSYFESLNTTAACATAAS